MRTRGETWRDGKAEQQQGRQKLAGAMLAVRLLGRWKRRGRKSRAWKSGTRSRGRAGLWGRLSFAFRDKGRRRELQGEGLRRLKRRLGDLSVSSPAQAASVQATIEDSIGGELSFAVQPGDVVLGDSDTLARCTPPGLAARRRGVHRSATWDGGGELELLQKHLQKQAAAVKRSSTLGSFSRMRKPGGKGEGVSSGPLVILTPPPSSSSGLSSTSRNFPQNGATDNMDPQPAQPFNNEPHPPNTSPSTSLIEDSGSESLKTSLLSLLNIDLFSRLHLGKSVSRR